MNEGQVVEQGTHEELLEKEGLYHAMWIEQASEPSNGEDEPPAETVELEGNTVLRR